MEMFNVHRRDVMNFDNYMDLKKPGFGGPNSAVAFKDKSGKRVVDNPKLKEFQRVVNRDPMFGSRHYDSTYKAMTHDVIYKQEKKKPFDYRDPYLTALPVVDITNASESHVITSFNQFLLETAEMDEFMGAEDENLPADYYDEDVPPTENEPEESALSDVEIDDIEQRLKEFED